MTEGRTPEEKRLHELEVLNNKQNELRKCFTLGKFEVVAVINGVSVSQGVIDDIEVAYDKFYSLKPVASFVQITQNLRNESFGGINHIVMQCSC